MATLFCTHVSGSGEPCDDRTIVQDGQRRFCARHHRVALSADDAYKARADAYNADPALVAARAAYDAAYADAWRARTTEAVVIDIPLEERTRIRLRNIGDDATEYSLWAKCEQYGRTGKISLIYKDRVRTGDATVGFYTHEEAARALSSLEGAVWVERVHQVAQTPTSWIVEAVPTVVAAKKRVTEEMVAARERQQPEIIAAERAEEAAERAEEEALRAEEDRERAREDEAERREWEYRRREDELDIAYAQSRNARGIRGPHERPERRYQREHEERYGGW